MWQKMPLGSQTAEGKVCRIHYYVLRGCRVAEEKERNRYFFFDSAGREGVGRGRRGKKKKRKGRDEKEHFQGQAAK